MPKVKHGGIYGWSETSTCLELSAGMQDFFAFQCCVSREGDLLHNICITGGLLNQSWR